MHSHPANHLIQAEVDLFMHTHSTVKAGDLSRLERAVRSAMKVEHREQRHAVLAPSTPRSLTPRSTEAFTCRSTTSGDGNGGKPSTCRVLSAAATKSMGQRLTRCGNYGEKSRRGIRGRRPSTAGSVRSDVHAGRKPTRGIKFQGSARSDCGSSTAHDDGSQNSNVPNNIKNEWLILETYQQLIADEKQAEQDREAQMGGFWRHVEWRGFAT